MKEADRGYVYLRLGKYTYLPWIPGTRKYTKPKVELSGLARGSDKRELRKLLPSTHPFLILPFTFLQISLHGRQIPLLPSRFI